MRWLEGCGPSELPSLTMDAPGVWHVRGTSAPVPDLIRHDVTAFLDPRHSRPVEELRSPWDPVMASQIAAHVTHLGARSTCSSAVALTAPWRSFSCGSWLADCQFGNRPVMSR